MSSDLGNKPPQDVYLINNEWLLDWYAFEMQNNLLMST